MLLVHSAWLFFLPALVQVQALKRRAKGPSYLFTQMAEHCTLKRDVQGKKVKYSLESDDMNPETYLFADIPHHSADTEPTQLFFETFDDNFVEDSPNAAITVNEYDGPPIICMLQSAVADEDAGLYKYFIKQSKSQQEVSPLSDFFSVESGDAEEVFDDCSIFIDGRMR
jgi:hypothetical protein